MSVSNDTPPAPLDAVARGWMARFGRTVGSHVLDAVGGRIAASRALPGATADGGFSAWARGAHTAFDDTDAMPMVDAGVTTGILGVDYAAEGLIAGIALAYSEAEGGYRGGATGGAESAFAGAYPYAGLGLIERVSVWGAAGYGLASLVLTPEGQPSIQMDTTLAMGAAGVRGEVATPSQAGGFSLAVEGDALVIRTMSAATSDLSAMDAVSSRLRLGLDGSWRFVTGAGALTPSLKVGVRHDGADEDVGARTGFDVGGGLSMRILRAVTLDLRGRGLLAQDASRFREWGLSGTLGYDPDPASERGLSLSLGAARWAEADGGTHTLQGAHALAGLVHGDDAGADGRLDAEAGYGLPMFDEHFTGTLWASLGLMDDATDYRVGWRLAPARDGRFGLAVEAQRRESANDDEHRLLLRLDAQY